MSSQLRSGVGRARHQARDVRAQARRVPQRRARGRVGEDVVSRRQAAARRGLHVPGRSHAHAARRRDRREDYRRLARLARSARRRCSRSTATSSSTTPTPWPTTSSPRSPAAIRRRLRDGGRAPRQLGRGRRRRDNGAGTVVVMEAARILAAVGVRPRRTIRFALWVGEEEGLLGSMAYTEKYLATRALAPSGAEGGIEQYLRWRYASRSSRGRATTISSRTSTSTTARAGPRPARRGQRRRGAAAPRVAPAVRQHGAGAVVASPTGGTDHVFMQAVGVPGYQFIQDPLDYGSRSTTAASTRSIT